MAVYNLTTHLCLPWEDCQQAVIDKFPRMLAGSVLGTNVCHWIFKEEVGLGGARLSTGSDR